MAEAVRFDVSALAAEADARNRGPHLRWLLLSILVPGGLTALTLGLVLFGHYSPLFATSQTEADLVTITLLGIYADGMLIIFGRRYHRTSARPVSLTLDSGGVEFFFRNRRRVRYPWNDRYRVAHLRIHRSRSADLAHGPAPGYSLFVSEPIWSSVLGGFDAVGRVPIPKEAFDAILLRAKESGAIVEELWSSGNPFGEGLPVTYRFPRGRPRGFGPQISGV